LPDLRHAIDLRARAFQAHDQYPRALFQSRTGRQPLYHIGIDELQDWAYAGEPLVPLKGFRGVVWERPRKKRAEKVAPF